MNKKLMMMASVLLAATVRADIPAEPKWETTIALGATMTQGNSSNTLINGSLLVQRKDDVNDFRFGADVTYGQSGEESTSDSGKIFANDRHVLSGRMYALIDAVLSYDNIANIDYRFVLSPGLGVYLLKSETTTLGVDIGPAYITEKIAGVTNDYNSSFALRVAERLDHKLTKTAKLWQSIEYLPETKDFGNYLLNVEIGTEAAMTEKINIRLVAKDAYDSTPAEGRKENDLSIVGALVIKI